MCRKSIYESRERHVGGDARTQVKTSVGVTGKIKVIGEGGATSRILTESL